MCVITTEIADGERIFPVRRRAKGKHDRVFNDGSVTWLLSFAYFEHEAGKNHHWEDKRATGFIVTVIKTGSAFSLKNPAGAFIARRSSETPRDSQLNYFPHYRSRLSIGRWFIRLRAPLGSIVHERPRAMETLQWCIHASDDHLLWTGPPRHCTSCSGPAPKFF